MRGYVWGTFISLAVAAAALFTGFVAVALFMLPVAAWFVSRVVVHGGFEAWTFARRGHMRKWNGRYYEFANIQLRAEELDDQLVFVESDLLKVIEQPRSATVELFGADERVRLSTGEIALTRAGCERLLRKCPHADAKKLLLFLQREAFFPYEKRHGHRQTA